MISACHGYDEIHPDQITSQIYEKTTFKYIWSQQQRQWVRVTDEINVPPNDLDDELLYKGLIEHDWTYVYKQQQKDNKYKLTPRKLHKITDWNYAYGKTQKSFFCEKML